MSARKKETYKEPCQCIIKSGINKGERCKNAALEDSDYCGKHQNCKVNMSNISTPKKKDASKPKKPETVKPTQPATVRPKTPTPKKEEKRNKTPDPEVEELTEGLRTINVSEKLPEESKSPRGLRSPVSPTSKRSRRTKGEYKEDVSSRSSRRYLLPARLPNFKSFVCNMLEYKAPDSFPEMKHYPIGYISYLLRAYSYDTTSIIPLNVADDNKLKPLLNQGLEFKDAFTKTEGREFKAMYLKDTGNSIVIPATLVYSDPACVYMKNDLYGLISKITQRQIVILAKEVWQGKDSYLAIFIDQKEDRKTIDIIPEVASRAGAGAGAGVGLSEERKRLIDDLFDTNGFTIRYHDRFDEGMMNPRIWQIMLIHLKLINKPTDSFESLQAELVKELKADGKDINAIIYSYYMKILRLSVDEKTDYELLSVFHGND